MATAGWSSPVEQLTSVLNPFATEIVWHHIIVHAGERWNLKLAIVWLGSKLIGSLWEPGVIWHLGGTSGGLNHRLVTGVHEESILVITAHLSLMSEECVVEL